MLLVYHNSHTQFKHDLFQIFRTLLFIFLFSLKSLENEMILIILTWLEKQVCTSCRLVDLLLFRFSECFDGL